MRVLVDGGPLERFAPRMRLAAAGLALRGHAVTWAGAPPPAGLEAAALTRSAAGAALVRHRADVALGSAERLLSGALRARLVHAHALVLDLDPAVRARWSALDRWAWHALHAAALVDPGRADEARGTLPEAMLERIGLWPDAAPATGPDPAHPDVEVLERACERALSRHRGLVARAAVFLDRDGTLIAEREYLADPAGVELLPGAAEGLARLGAAGYPLIVISNQSGIGRGLFPERRAHEVMARLRQLLRARGVELDGIYFCPHRPDAGCACRKPGIALLERAADDHQLALARSVMVGDKRIDARSGRRAGGVGVLLRTGYGRAEEREAQAGPAADAPDRVFDDLAEAARWIIARGDLLAPWE